MIPLVNPIMNYKYGALERQIIDTTKRLKLLVSAPHPISLEYSKCLTTISLKSTSTSYASLEIKTSRVFLLHTTIFMTPEPSCFDGEHSSHNTR